MNYWLTNKTYLLWLILVIFLSPAQGQEPSFVQLHEEPEFTIVAGEEQFVPLSFLIKEGYHIQADQVKDENLVPSVLSMEASNPNEVTMGNPVFPPPVEFWMDGVEEPLLVFSSILTVNVPLKTAKSTEKGELSIKGKLHYQACDVSKCYFPRDLPFVMKINIE